MTKVAVIGVGNIGYQHARLYSSFDNIKLVGIADLNEKLGKKAAKEFNTNYYKDYLELIKTEKPTAITIAVPTIFHKDVAISLMPYVSKMLIEKPLADNTQDAEKILQAAEKYKVKVAVGYVERFNPVVSELKKIILKKQIGKPISIVIKRVGLFPPNSKNADVITDLATHDIDILTYLFNTTPQLITATGGKLLHNNYDHAELLFDYGNVKCFIQTNWITPVKIRSIAVTGSEGYLDVDYITQDLTFYKTAYKRTFINYTDFILKFGKPKRKILAIKKAEPLKLELEAFIKSSKQLATGQDGLNALIVAENAIKYIAKNHK